MKQQLNLMSRRAHKKEQIRYCTRLWTRAFVVVVASLTFLGIKAWHNCQVEQRRLALMEAEYEPIRQLKIENGRLQREINALRDAERIPLELAKHRPLLALLGLAAQTVLRQEDRLYLNHLEIEQDPTRQLSKTQPSLSFALEGVTVDSSAITRVANTLQTEGPFATVELSTSKSASVGKQQREAFAIQCAN